MMIEDNEMLNKIEILKNCSYIEQDFRGHSHAIRYIAGDNGNKYFIKISNGNRKESLNWINDIYQSLSVRTAEIQEIGYLENVDKTYIIFEYLEGNTLRELTKKASAKELEDIGIEIGASLAKFQQIKANKDDVINLYEEEFEKLITNLLAMVRYCQQNEQEELGKIDIERLCKNFHKLKKIIYETTPFFIHGDINLNNVIVKENRPYFVDIEGGKFSFQAFDFRGICWWTWEGENRKEEQAIYRGVFKGLFNKKVPDKFHQELACTVIYEFLLKVNEVNETKDMKRLEYLFQKFGDIFNRTDYFESYQFDWVL